MDSFDEFLRAELDRVKLDEYGRTRQVALAGSEMLDRMAGKVSLRAKGSANLKKKTQEIIKEFKVFCGEQQIPYKEVKLEDYAVFLNTKGIGSGDNNRKLVYGDFGGDSSHQADIDNLVEQMNKYIGTKEDIPEELYDKVLELAKEDKETENSIRSSLWKLQRKYPREKQAFEPVGKLVGQPLSVDHLFKLSTSIAMILLRAGDRDGVSSGGKSEVKSEGDDDTGRYKKNSLKDGMEAGPKDFTQRINAKVFTELLPEAGLKLELFNLFGKDIANALAAKQDEQEAKMKSVAIKIDRLFTEQQCVRLTRLLMHHVAPNDKNEILKPLYAYANTATVSKLQTALNEVAKLINAGRSGEYNATLANQKINEVISTETSAAKMLSLMIYCVYSHIKNL